MKDKKTGVQHVMGVLCTCTLAVLYLVSLVILAPKQQCPLFPDSMIQIALS